ncbi:MAG: DUF2800 domain-containing protein [Bacteroidales bacterium]|nr:DUF2800 domain-containing protein [Bacteroidales bacterium]
MNWNRHFELEGRHAPFSASQSSWLRYDDDKLLTRYSKIQAAAYGTRLHAWAKETIDLRLRQPEIRKTINMYVNDAIGFNMKTEVVLYYSKYFFGTADTICFRNNFLRIHDLKTGEHSASMEQLKVYAALFCLEYRIKPSDIQIELRIYQNDRVHVEQPTAEEIIGIMEKIVHNTKILEKYEEG